MRVLAIVAVLGCDAGTRAAEHSTRDTVVSTPHDAVAASQDAVATAQDAAAPADTSDKLVMEYRGNSRIGDIDKQVIRKKIKGHLSEIVGCLESHPTAASRIVIQFTLASDGRVVDASVGGVSPSTGNCIASVIKYIDFPAPRDPVRITYPFWIDTAGQ